MASRLAPSSIPMCDIGNECWNERSERRTAVLHRLKVILKEKLGKDVVPPPFWAFCQLADIAKLEEMIFDAEEALNTRVAQRLLEPTIDDCDSMIARWLQNLSSSKSTSSGTNRSTTASNKCKERDNYECVFTGWEEPDDARIYPQCLIKASGREPRAVARFWGILDWFWEDDHVQRWKKEIFGDPQNLKAPKDGCFNMISLNKHLHSLWGAGRFALRPMEISADHKELKVEFHWQPKPSHGTEEIDLLTEPASSRGLYTYDGKRGFSAPEGDQVYKAICSGDVFSIITNDSSNLPLPSWDLLEMQWHLQRIAGMSGAAEAEEDVGDDDKDDKNEMTTFHRDGAVRRVNAIFEWLKLVPENERPALYHRPSVAL
ncbi:hypothetical protein AJ79_10083 [Helicocarpus griseus UAMH5409]|uniref:HNH nuclease domain-containing protein n=1 Tax=Helicocarpus griseus UAMH5409 TaxID=1447875 RepID=A0A2B7WFJ5_9EURO|nr:hypothetical protein AJ79_10083 [Helicocarpus griseus UAMH5409]